VTPEAAGDLPLVALVGKGVCFDSGGLDIKTAAGMKLMKKVWGVGESVRFRRRWGAWDRVCEVEEKVWGVGQGVRFRRRCGGMGQGV
jgi:hypothetical protein